MVKSDIWTSFYWDDYSRDTIGLSMLQHGAYFLLLKAYYMQSHMLRHCDRYRIAYAHEDAERQATDEVLARFFEKTPDGHWKHPRAEKEIEKNRTVRQQASEAAKKRWGAKKSKANECGSDADAYADALRADMQTTTTTIIRKKEPTSVGSKESAPAQSGYSTLAEDWTLPDDWREDARVKFAFSPVQLTEAIIDRVASQFRDYMVKEGRQSQHWRQAWGYWCGNEVKRLEAEAAKQKNSKKSVTEIQRGSSERAAAYHRELERRANEQALERDSGGVREPEHLRQVSERP